MNVADYVKPQGTSGEIAWKQSVSLPETWFHPHWRERESRWRLYEACYEGGLAMRLPAGDLVTLYQHERETDKKYADRVKNAFYRNHGHAIVGLKADAIFQPGVSRALDKAPDFEPWTKDVDLKGTDLSPFMNLLARKLMTCGLAWAEMAIPSADRAVAFARAEGRAVSVPEAAAAKVRPFLALRGPREVINWSEDEYGELEYAVILAEDWKRPALPEKKDAAAKPRLLARVLYPDREVRFEVGAQGKLSEGTTIPHSFGRVPLVKFCRRSEMEDLADLLVAIFNGDSMVSEQARKQCFNQLVLTLDNPKDGMAVVTGTDAVLPLKVGDGAAFLAPDVKTISALREWVSELIDEAWAMANLRSRPGGKGSQPQADSSGVAFAYEWHAAEADLAGIASVLEEGERKIAKMYGTATKNPAEPKISYSREFDIRALRARADEAAVLQKLQIGKTAEGHLLKALVRKAVPGAPAEDLAKSDTEIEALAERREKKLLEAPKPPPGPTNTPPNQGMLPPGQGSQADRAMKPPPEKDEEPADEDPAP